MGIYFDGSTQYGHLPTESLWNSSAVFSHCVWVKPDTGFVTEQHVFGGFNATTLTHFSGTVLRGDQATKTLSKYKSSSTLYYGGSASYVPTANAWNLHFYSRNGTGTSAQACRYFVNNSATGTNTAEEQTSTNINKWGFGARRVAAGTYQNFFKGKIGCAAIWNRVLTIAEEDSIKAGAHPSTIPSGLVDIFEFNGTGTPATSTSANGRVVTWVGSPALDTDSPFSAIVNITPDPMLVDAAFTVSTTGFPNGAANFSIGGITVAITLSSGSATSSLPAFYDVMPLPFLPATAQTATLTQGALTATMPVGVGLPSGFDVTRDGSDIPANFAGIVTDDPKYIGYHFLAAGNPLTTNDRCYWPMMTVSGKSIAIDQDGRVRVPEELFDESGTIMVPLWVHRADGNIYAHEMTINADGVVTSVTGISRAAISDTGITHAGISSSGLR